MGIVKVLFAQLIILVCLASSAYSANADIVDAPDSVGIGQPFLVQVTLPYIALNIEVVWNDKSIRPSVDYREGKSYCIVLLGTPLKSQPGHGNLLVKAFGDGGMELYSRDIAIVEHPYEKETLNVAPKLVSPPEEMKERLQQEHEAAMGAIYTASAVRRWNIPFSLPVKGKMLSAYGLYRVFNGSVKARHKGQDFRAYLGTPICSIAPGKVVLVGRDFFYAGNCVYIDHGNGLVSSYAHMSEVLVKCGEQVRQGQEIGLSGATGRTNGAHLHLSVYAQGVNIDPVPLFSMQ